MCVVTLGADNICDFSHLNRSIHRSQVQRSLVLRAAIYLSWSSSQLVFSREVDVHLPKRCVPCRSVIAVVVLFVTLYCSFDVIQYFCLKMSCRLAFMYMCVL